ncbi:MAG: anti-sigma regulatory factor [Deltaproteobacteria bacterium]|nr:anti-sigma regulatory factor [Deltaproteobacteria bacterium]
MVDSMLIVPQIKLEFKIKEGDYFMAGEAASRVKKTLQQTGLQQEIIKKIAIIIYEAAMNVSIHGNHGMLRVYIDPESITVETEDEGVGIPDIELAMQEGYSTASREVREMGFGAGMGLFNIKQCSDELHIQSKVGVGTTLQAKVLMDKKDHA